MQRTSVGMDLIDKLQKVFEELVATQVQIKRGARASRVRAFPVCCNSMATAAEWAGLRCALH